MPWLQEALARVRAGFRALFRAGEADARMEEEFRFHVDMETERLTREQGLAPDEARRRALARFGRLDTHRESMRDGRGARWVADLMADARYALRGMRRSPTFVVAVALTLGVGIGVNGIVFGFVDALLFRPLPVRDSQRLVGMYNADTRSNLTFDVGYADYVDFRDKSGVFDGLAASSGVPLNVVASPATRVADMVWGEMVTENYFTMLGMRPALGRFFQTGDAPQGADPFAVISYDAWTRRFGGDPAIIGKSLRINGTGFTIVGVAPRDFRGLRTVGFWPEIWVPVGMHDVVRPGSMDMFQARGGGGMTVVGRMRRGMDRARTEAAARGFAQQLAVGFPASNTDVGVVLVPGAIGFDNPAFVKPAAIALASALGIFASLVILTIICANLGNLQLARAAARGHEIAIRLSLGCSRARLARQLVVESAVLALPGVVVAALLIRLMPRIEQAMVPHLQFSVGFKPSVDVRIVVFSAGVALFAVALFGILPALRATKTRSLANLIGAPRTSLGRPQRMRGMLVVSQLALSVVLLVGASLFVRSLALARAADLGFDSHDRALVSVNVGLENYDKARGGRFYDDVLARVRDLPSVVSASWAFPVPFDTYGRSVSIYVPGASSGPNAGVVAPASSVVAEDFVDALGLRTESGRDFTTKDSVGAPLVMVVSRKLATQLWPGKDPVGQRARRDSANGREITVVGVVADAEFVSSGAVSQPRVYLPLRQNYRDIETLVVHTRGDAALALPRLRSVINATDPALPVYGAITMDASVANGLSQPRNAAVMAGFFGALALAIAAVGLYAVVSSGVTERTREIGVRMALGSTPRQMVLLVMGGATRLGAIGLVIGIAAAVFVARIVASLLYGLSPADPVTFLIVPTLLAVVVVLATLIPAWRAVKLDPIAALRQE